MSTRVVVHLVNTDPFVADIEAMPPADAAYIYVTNPRTREGRPVPWDSGGTRGFIFPFSRVSYVELMISEEQKQSIQPFFRDNTKA
jgi:hypothetical protein